MRTNRRAFVAAGLTAAWTGATRSAAAADPPDGVPVLDYGRSFVSGTASFNSVRFWVESRTLLFDGDRRFDFLQFGSCKSENTFGEKDLFYADNYDFLPILGDDGQWLVFRRKSRLTPEYRALKKDIWGPAQLQLREAARVSPLETWEQIRDATAAGKPIVSRTELTDAETGLRAIIECPVKTLNVSHDRKMYQVDTGPVALPDLGRRYEPRVDCVRLAFVAFNAPHFADFVIEQPTGVAVDGHECCQVLHYSHPISLPARNTLLALEDV